MNQANATHQASRPVRPLRGVRVLSLSLNLPGPAALMRCLAMGARCVKLEPPHGDPMQHYQAQAYQTLSQGVEVKTADLKTAAGHKSLARLLARADVLLTSFRPSALAKLGLDWRTLHRQYPALCLVRIVGAPGPQAELPGHDLTYQAEHDLVTGLNLPASLMADMAGALMASEAVLQAVLLRAQNLHQGKAASGVLCEVALSEAARWLALPRSWGLTTPDGAVGGAHAGYQVYACRDGRVAVAALEPHFAQRLCQAAGLPQSELHHMLAPTTRAHVAQWMAQRSRSELEQLASALDIPLMTLP